MTGSFSRKACLAALLACFYAACPGPAPFAVAQTQGELRAEQQRLAAALLDDPANIEMMFAHANVSIRLADYEAAITTLERLLIFEQDLTRVRLELGVAYFNLGSYQVAELYLTQALQSTDLDASSRDAANTYLREIQQRAATNQLEIVTNLGLTYASNANLGPVDDTVTILGTPGFSLAPASRSQDDFGVRVLLYGAHTYNLDRPNDDAWVTNFTLFAVRYFDVEEGNTVAARVRTGPRLNLTDRSDGAKLRPYAEFGYLNNFGNTVYVSGFGGAELTVPLEGEWSLFGDLGVGYLEYDSSRIGQDRTGVRFIGGFAVQPQRNIVGRVAAIAEHYAADEDYNTSTELGARISGNYSYISGFNVDARWQLSGYLDARYRFFDEPDAFIDPTRTREEFDLRAGLSHLFALGEGFGIQLDVEGFLRESNIQNFDLNNVSVTLSAQYRL